MAADPADTPTGPSQRVASAALGAWIAGGTGAALGAVLVATVVVPVIDEVDGMPGWVRPLVIAVVAIGCVLLSVVAPVVRYRTWRYGVTPDEIDLVHGSFVRRRTIIPMARVQHVETERGLLENMLDIATLKIHTAAGVHKIPGLPDAAAAALRTEIAQQARVPDDV